MLRSGRWRVPRPAALVMAALAGAASCGPAPTEPAARPRVLRTVTAVLADSLGAPVAGASLVWVSRFESAGTVQLRYRQTDSDGECREVLAEGGWLVATTPGPSVAAASLVVSGPERAAADTQVVRLTMRTASRATGTVTLAGRTDHRGTIVSGETGALALTDSTGAWALDGLAPGRWTVWMENFGFKSANVTVVVTTPGSVVTVPTVNLVSDP